MVLCEEEEEEEEIDRGGECVMVVSVADVVLSSLSLGSLSLSLLVWDMDMKVLLDLVFSPVLDDDIDMMFSVIIPLSCPSIAAGSSPLSSMLDDSAFEYAMMNPSLTSCKTL